MIIAEAYVVAAIVGIPLYVLFLLVCFKAGRWLLTSGECPSCHAHRKYWSAN